MKIYIAGRLSQRKFLHQIRTKLWKLGHEVVSTWIDEGTDGKMGASLALRDLCQISLADVLILDTTSPLKFDGGGGREFEAGFAFAKFHHGIFWRVGPVKNTFHLLANISFPNWNSCLKYLER